MYIAPPISGSMSLKIDFGTLNLTATDTPLIIYLAAGDMIDIMVTGNVSKSAGSTGLRVAIGAPSGAVVTGFRTGCTNALNTVQNDIISSGNTLGVAFCTAIATALPFTIQVSVINSTTAGNVTIQLASVTSNTATMLAGSKMTWNKSIQV